MVETIDSVSGAPSPSSRSKARSTSSPPLRKKSAPTIEKRIAREQLQPPADRAGPPLLPARCGGLEGRHPGRLAQARHVEEMEQIAVAPRPVQIAQQRIDMVERLEQREIGI